MKVTNAAGIEILIDDGELRRLTERFQEAMKPFGLDEFVLADTPRVIEMLGGRFLAELRTSLLPIWYPEKLMKLENAGFEVVRKTKKPINRAPCEMYYVRTVWEIGGIQNGN